MILSLLLSVLPSAGPEPERAWTLLFYGAADNDSEETLVPDMRNAMDGLPLEGVEVLAFVDRSPDYSSNGRALGEDFADARLYRLTAEGAERLPGGPQFPEITLERSFEANSGDVGTLRKALRWARATSPARHYGVVFYSHGGGDSWCPDETDGGDLLYPAELSDGLEEKDSLDLIVFDVCLMGGVENAYQWRPGPGRFGADIMVATPMAGFPFPWGRILRQAGGAEGGVDKLTPRRFGEQIVEVVEADRAEGLAQEGLPPHLLETISYEAMGCYDLGQAAHVKRATDRLAGELNATDGARAGLEQLRGSGEEIGLLHYMAPNLAEGWASYPYFDLFDLARRIPLIDGAGDGLKQAARELAQAVDEMVIASYGMPGYERYDFVPGATGLYVVFPDGERNWGAFDWYTPHALEAGSGGYGRYAWCADGALEQPGQVGNWYELLCSWYQTH